MKKGIVHIFVYLQVIASTGMQVKLNFEYRGIKVVIVVCICLYFNGLPEVCTTLRG